MDCLDHLEMSQFMYYKILLLLVLFKKRLFLYTIIWEIPSPPFIPPVDTGFAYCAVQSNDTINYFVLIQFDKLIFIRKKCGKF